MWNFTVSGFTSVVEYDPPATHYSMDAKKHVPFDDGIINNLPEDYHPADKDTLSSHVLVRARIKEDLEALKTYDPEAIETEDKNADYQYRLVMRRTAYATFMYDSVMTLDYNSHVKETIDKRAPKVVGGRYGALSSIWSACARWQPNTPWGGTVAYGGYGTNNGGYGDNGTGTKYQQKTYWDSSLGKWMPIKGQQHELVTPKAGNHQFVGDLPKEPSGSGEKERTDSASQGADWPPIETLDRMLDGIDMDNPWVEPSPMIPLGETAEGLTVTAEATRNSMVAQLKDIVRERGVTCEIEALVDHIQETWGTCDIDTIPDDLMLDLLNEFESVSKILARMDA